MNSAIITIGTEILIGSILNTNGKYLSEKLSDLGVHVSFHISVRDDYPDLKDQIKEMLKRVDILFLCGGLGPTEDDMTKETLSEIIDKKIILDKNQYKKLLDRFNKQNRKMTENNKKQAMVIENSLILDNKWGIAPGELIEYKDKKIILLPGPPKEFIPMVDFYLGECIHDEQEIVIKSLNVAGLGESLVEDRLRRLNLINENISINTFAKFYDTEIKIIGEGKNRKELESEIEYVVQSLYEEFGHYLYAEDNVSLKETTVKKLIENNKKISFAESITGGLLASSITSVSGASNIIDCSFVTYSNNSKTNILNVNPETIKAYGAVSSETALEMVKGLKEITKSNICISTTGEAGPNVSEKDLGTVFVGYSYGDNDFKVKEYKFNGNRNEIQKRVVNTILLDILFNIGG